MAKIEVRPTNPSDQDGLHTLYRESFGKMLRKDYPQQILDRALPLLSQVNEALISSGKYYLANDEAGNVMGAGGWSHEMPGQGRIIPGTIHIRHFAVLPKFAHRGVARAIFDRCLDDAVEAASVECFSTKTAQPFYASLGFAVIREFDVNMGPELAFPSVHMKMEVGKGRMHI